MGGVSECNARLQPLPETNPGNTRTQSLATNFLSFNPP